MIKRMKAINNFIVEHLKYSTFSINEKLKISSKSNIYTCQPKDRYELRKILEERLAEDKNANLNDIDVSQITNMNGLFRNLPITPYNIKLEYWDVSNVIEMENMFYGCENFNADLSNWDVSKVTSMLWMFWGCEKFNSDLSRWDVSSVIDMRYMFDECHEFNADLSNWNVSKVTNMQFMFNRCEKFTGKGLENWNVSKVKDMDYMFDECDSLKNIPSWYKK